MKPSSNNQPCISHQGEGHDGEEHESKKDEKGEVDGATDVVGEGGGGLPEFIGDKGPTARTVTSAIVVAKAGNPTHCEPEIL